EADSRRRHCQGRHRGGRPLRLGPLYRRGWRLYRHDRLRRERAGAGTLSSLQHHPGSRGCRREGLSRGLNHRQENGEMAVRVAINGFGRIGRLVLRAIAESGRKDIEVVAINDLGSVEANAHLLKWDSVHGPFPGKIKTTKSSFDLGRGQIKVLAERDPAKLPWKELGVDIALECTGLFTARDKASAHLTAGAKRVLISAPGEDADITVVYG